MENKVCYYCGKTKDQHYVDVIMKDEKFWCIFGSVIAVICTYKPE